MGKSVALLRGVNVGGGNKVPMAELRALAVAAGFTGVSTWINSGNLLFETAPRAPEAALEQAMAERFGLSIPVMVRSAAQWKEIRVANPLPEAAAAAPARLMVGFSKAPLAPGTVEALQERATTGERVAAAGGALFIYYPQGGGSSKLMPGLIDRIAGSPCTSRNWRTVAKIGDLLI